MVCGHLLGWKLLYENSNSVLYPRMGVLCIIKLARNILRYEGAIFALLRFVTWMIRDRELKTPMHDYLETGRNIPEELTERGDHGWSRFFRSPMCV